MTNLTLEQRIERIEAVNEIQNVMGRYAFWHTANMHRECMNLFALKTIGVKAEMPWGVYEGAESLERLYPGFHHWRDKGTGYLSCEVKVAIQFLRRL